MPLSATSEYFRFINGILHRLTFRTRLFFFLDSVISEGLRANVLRSGAFCSGYASILVGDGERPLLVFARQALLLILICGVSGLFRLASYGSLFHHFRIEIKGRVTMLNGRVISRGLFFIFHRCP